MKAEGPTLYVELMGPDIKVPAKTNPTDSGFDVFANSFVKYYQNFGSNGERLIEGKLLENMLEVGARELQLSYMERVLIGTGLRVTVGPGYEVQVRPRSGLALKKGLTVLNTPGTIDEGYKGEVAIIIVNLSRQNQIVQLGTRIAQLVVTPVILPEIQVVPALPNIDRGGGFGHSGVK